MPLPSTLSEYDKNDSGCYVDDYFFSSCQLSSPFVICFNGPLKGSKPLKELKISCLIWMFLK